MKIGNAIRDLTEATPRIGWRAWVVTETAGGLRLGSVLHDEIWTPATTALATCRRREELFADPPPQHPAPTLECGCGFHAARDPADALPYLRGRDEPATVCRILGEVALWGRLVETEVGYRAGAAYPVRLYAPDQTIAEELEIYGVPVLVGRRDSAIAGTSRRAHARTRTRDLP
jgi:hypothetical protein